MGGGEKERGKKPKTRITETAIFQRKTNIENAYFHCFIKPACSNMLCQSCAQKQVSTLVLLSRLLFCETL